MDNDEQFDWEAEYYEQLAVDYLIEKIRLLNKKVWAELYEEIKKAKHMEKIQIIAAYETGSLDYMMSEIYPHDEDFGTDSEEYYENLCKKSQNKQ